MYLKSASTEHGRKSAYSRPQIDVNKGVRYSEMIQKESCCVFGQRSLPQETWTWQPLLEKCSRRQHFMFDLRRAGRAAGRLRECLPIGFWLEPNSLFTKMTDRPSRHCSLRKISVQCFRSCQWVKGSLRHWNCCWSKEYRKYRMKNDFECVFPFGNPSMFLMFSFNVPFIYLEPFHASGR